MTMVSPGEFLLLPLLLLVLLELVVGPGALALPLVAITRPQDQLCPSKCECLRSSPRAKQRKQQYHHTEAVSATTQSPTASSMNNNHEEHDDDDGEDDDDEVGVPVHWFSVRCLRGGINDTDFLALLQALPPDVRELEIRSGRSGSRPNQLQWNDNINRLSRLQRLVLANSGIPALSQSIRLPLLRELDLSGNSLEHIQLGSFLGMPMLERLDLSHNRISVLPTGAFIYLKKLSSLSLSHNRLTPELTAGNLLRGPRGLKELELDGNWMSARQLNELFGDLASLTRLEMNQCGLSDAEVWTLNLSSVPLVRRIGLAGNNLTQVPGATLRALALLETVDLSHNLIRTLGPCAFCGSNISRVLLAHNLLGLSARPINREAFADTRMRELDLSNNHLGEFDSAMLWGAQDTLEVLHLSGNGLSMDGALLRTLPRLKELHMADSQLGSVPYSLPKVYAQLTLLNLSGNALDLLPPNLGSMLPQLRVLDLSHNLFSSFPHPLMNFIDQLELVYLHHCPWDCQCAAQPLQVHMLHRLDHRELLAYDETLCAEPAMLRGQPLHRVQRINDCAILFGANYGITQNTELMLILGALLVAALVLSAVLVASLYCGRGSGKQKGTYVTGEGIGADEEEETEQKQKQQLLLGGGTTTTMSRSTTLMNNGMAGRGLLDLDVMAMNGDVVAGGVSTVGDHYQRFRKQNGAPPHFGGPSSCSPLTVQNLRFPATATADPQREPLLLSNNNSNMNNNNLNCSPSSDSSLLLLSSNSSSNNNRPNCSPDSQTTVVDLSHSTNTFGRRQSSSTSSAGGGPMVQSTIRHPVPPGAAQQQQQRHQQQQESGSTTTTGGAPRTLVTF